MKSIITAALILALASCQKEYSYQASQPRQTAHYDTTVITDGQHVQTFTFPGSGGGTIILTKVVTIRYGYDLRNNTPGPVLYAVTLGRWDNITGTGIPKPIDDTLLTNAGVYGTTPGDRIVVPERVFVDRWTKSDTLTNVPAFTQAVYTYSPRTYTILKGSRQYYFQATASDTVRLHIAYYSNLVK